MSPRTDRTEIQAERDMWGRCIRLLVLERRDGRTHAVGTNVTMETVPDDGIDRPHEATMEMRMPAAQRLMDSLWQCGLRPSEGTGSAGALAAVERHLAAAEKNAEHWRETATNTLAQLRNTGDELARLRIQIGNAQAVVTR
jgi:hypothetical protein